MKIFLLNVRNEIINGQNLDIYLTMLVGFVLIVFDIFGIASQNAITSGILATLLLITFNSLNTRQVNSELRLSLREINLAKTSLAFFHEWDELNFKQHLITAKDISVMAVSPYEFVNNNTEQLKELVRQGASLRFVMIDPYGTAINMTSLIFQGSAVTQSGYLLHQVEMTLQKIKEIALESNRNKVKVKLIDNIPPAVLTMINSKSNNATIFVTLNGINCPVSSRPSFTLSKNCDGKWFDFYQNSFENLWKSSEAKEKILIN